MTTDITELAPAMKAAAEKASSGDWVKESGDGWDATCSNDDQANSGFIIANFIGPDSAANREFVQLANPANVKRLVEALENTRNENELARGQLLIAGRTLLNQQAKIAELESSGIAPGILRCSECSFVETKNIISVTADTITTGNSEPDPCPNGCGRLQPVTWKALAIQLMFTTKQGVSDLLEAKKRIAELEERERANAAQDDHINQQQDRIDTLEKRNAELGKYAGELESFRTAYMEWSDKTDWVQTDKRFGVVKPLGKHRADVLKEYIQHLESRTVKLPQAVSAGGQGYQEQVERILTAAGIKWEAE